MKKRILPENKLKSDDEKKYLEQDEFEKIEFEKEYPQEHFRDYIQENIDNSRRLVLI